MQKLQLMDKYPIYSMVVQKTETNFKSVDAILTHIQALIEAHPIAKYIATFDHYEHTKSIEDCVIDEGILKAKNIIFCFGKQLPNAKILAVRPRSLGVCEFEDRFEMAFLEVPNEKLQVVMASWVESLKN